MSTTIEAIKPGPKPNKADGSPDRRTTCNTGNKAQTPCFKATYSQARRF